MTMLAEAVVDVDKLVNVVLVALLSGIGVTTLFAIAVFGATRFSDQRTTGGAALGAYACLALVAFAGCLASVVYGVVLLTA
ncbi:MAG TPA: hypothetical protein VLJ42_05060 [Solirubrobacteraceae bacterium]|nr:hypothetical protein [Solirubrobacteraceae bacterium]